MNNNKPKVILIDYITINEYFFRIILVNFLPSEKQKQKMIQVYGIDNILEIGDSNRKHIKVTMIPFPKERNTDLRIIWQGIKEGKKYKTVDQLIHKYHDLDVNKITKIIEKSRVVKRLNQQSEILSVNSDDQELFDTDTMRNYNFVKKLLSNTKKDMSFQEFLDDRRSRAISELTQIKQEREEEKIRINKIKEHDQISKFFDNVMIEIKKGVKLKKTLIAKAKEFELTASEKDLKTIILLQNSGLSDVKELIRKPNIYEIKSKIFVIKNKKDDIKTNSEGKLIINQDKKTKKQYDDESNIQPLNSDDRIKISLKNRDFIINFDELKIYIQRNEWDKTKIPNIEEVQLLKTKNHSMVFPNELCDIKKYKRRHRVKKMNYLRIYSKTPNVRLLKHNSIDEETISILKSPDLNWMNGFIPKLDNFYINSPYNGNEYNILLKFQGRDERNSILIKTPIDLYCSELQAKLHFIVRACYGWPSITNIDFTDMPWHQYFDDFYMNDND
jgi:hypothetical protein